MWTRNLFRSVARRQQASPSRSLNVEKLEDRCVMSADPVLFWNGVMLQAAVTDYAIGGAGDQLGPTRTSRAFAIVQGAVYDAVNSIDPDYTPYLIRVAAPKDASVHAAVAEAAYTTLVSLYPYQKAYFQTQLAASLQNIPLDPDDRGHGGRQHRRELHSGRTCQRWVPDRCGRPPASVYLRSAAGPVARRPAPPQRHTA